MTGQLPNDCFALPPGIAWTPVRTALDTLKDRLDCVTGSASIDVGQAAGRILAAPVRAARDHPPFANSAVDGYGFARASLPGFPASLPLIDGRAAAGAPFSGSVPPGRALRVLTGAALPDGVDCVALDEDVVLSEGHVHLNGSLRPGANCRPAGEDIRAGAEMVPEGRRMTPGDIAAAVSAGVATVQVRDTLRVAVLSTGDEVVPHGQDAGPGRIFDANRPMLIATLRTWGYSVVDLGHVRDDAQVVLRALDTGAAQADAILTTGGASAGDEDHVSATLRAADGLHLWRIAIKPGRPLALALWNGVPVFGLPGNPVAAFVCTLVFARPALARLAGAPWSEPRGITLPAAFAKKKKPGRMEYLRARIEDGHAAVFPSEGSGRVSGLSWADGLVEIGHDAADITPGAPVTYIPFTAFGLI